MLAEKHCYVFRSPFSASKVCFAKSLDESHELLTDESFHQIDHTDVSGREPPHNNQWSVQINSWDQFLLDMLVHAVLLENWTS